MDPFGLMDLFESGEAPGHQETLKIHYDYQRLFAYIQAGNGEHESVAKGG